MVVASTRFVRVVDRYRARDDEATNAVGVRELARPAVYYYYLSSSHANARHFDHHVRPREEHAHEGEDDPRPTRTSPVFAIHFGLSTRTRARAVDVSFEARLNLGQRRARTTESALESERVRS